MKSILLNKINYWWQLKCIHFVDIWSHMTGSDIWPLLYKLCCVVAERPWVWDIPYVDKPDRNGLKWCPPLKWCGAKWCPPLKWCGAKWCPPLKCFGVKWCPPLKWSGAKWCPPLKWCGAKWCPPVEVVWCQVVPPVEVFWCQVVPPVEVMWCQVVPPVEVMWCQVVPPIEVMRCQVVSHLSQQDVCQHGTVESTGCPVHSSLQNYKHIVVSERIVYIYIVFVF